MVGLYCEVTLGYKPRAVPRPAERAGAEAVRREGRDRVAVVRLGATGPLSQGAKEGRQALGVSRIRGMEARRKRPRGFRCAPWTLLGLSLLCAVSRTK